MDIKFFEDLLFFSRIDLLGKKNDIEDLFYPLSYSSDQPILSYPSNQPNLFYLVPDTFLMDLILFSNYRSSQIGYQAIREHQGNWVGKWTSKCWSCGGHFGNGVGRKCTQSLRSIGLFKKKTEQGNGFYLSLSLFHDQSSNPKADNFNAPLPALPLFNTGLDDSIVIRKGVRSYTKHSLSNFVSYHCLNPNSKAFTTRLCWVYSKKCARGLKDLKCEKAIF